MHKPASAPIALPQLRVYQPQDQGLDRKQFKAIVEALSDPNQNRGLRKSVLQQVKQDPALSAFVKTLSAGLREIGIDHRNASSVAAQPEAFQNVVAQAVAKHPEAHQFLTELEAKVSDVVGPVLERAKPPREEMASQLGDIHRDISSSEGVKNHNGSRPVETGLRAEQKKLANAA